MKAKRIEAKDTNYVKRKIDEICTQITSGGTPKKSNAQYYIDGNIPWLKTKEVDFCRIYNTENKITELALKESSAKIIPSNSVIIAMYGDGITAGKVAINKIPVTTNQACCNLVIDHKSTNYEFIYYRLKNDYQKLVDLKNGGAQQNLSVGVIKNIELNLPPLPEQRAIAEILSSIDDKIELNNQMNRTLESIAQAIFKQWFVDFEFPKNLTVSDSQNSLLGGARGPLAAGDALSLPKCEVKMIDSELGLIPEGWECVYYTDIINVLGGGTPPKSNDAFWNGNIPFFTPKDISNSSYIFLTEEYITEEGLQNCNSKLYPRDTVFIAARGTVGKICLAGVGMAMNQSCYALAGIKDIGQYFVYLQTLDLISRLKQNSHGSVFSTITTDTFRKIKIIKPDLKIISIFENTVSPIFDIIHNNTVENQTLSALRDSLLPNLMSGDLRVPEEIVKRYENV